VLQDDDFVQSALITQQGSSRVWVSIWLIQSTSSMASFSMPLALTRLDTSGRLQKIQNSSPHNNRIFCFSQQKMCTISRIMCILQHTTITCINKVAFWKACGVWSLLMSPRRDWIWLATTENHHIGIVDFNCFRLVYLQTTYTQLGTLARLSRCPKRWGY